MDSKSTFDNIYTQVISNTSVLFGNVFLKKYL